MSDMEGQDPTQINVKFEDLILTNINVIMLVGSCTGEIFHPSSTLSIKYESPGIQIEIESPSGYITAFEIYITQGKKNKITFHVTRTDPNGMVSKYEKDPTNVHYPVEYFHKLRRMKDQHVSNKQRGVLW